MDFNDVVFVGIVEKLSSELTEYARNNDVHETDDIDIVCHCDFCQVFIPMAQKMERFIASAEKVSVGKVSAVTVPDHNHVWHEHNVSWMRYCETCHETQYNNGEGWKPYPF